MHKSPILCKEHKAWNNVYSFGQFLQQIRRFGQRSGFCPYKFEKNCGKFLESDENRRNFASEINNRSQYLFHTILSYFGLVSNMFEARRDASLKHFYCALLHPCYTHIFSHFIGTFRNYSYICTETKKKRHEDFYDISVYRWRNPFCRAFPLWEIGSVYMGYDYCQYRASVLFPL